MMSRRRLTVCLLCAAAGLVVGGPGVAAPQPSPEELWKVYPMDPAGTGARPRPRAAIVRETTAKGEAQPRGGVAGASRTQRPRTTVTREDDSGTPVAVGLMIGVAAAAIILLALAALPPAAAFGRVAGLAANRRVDLLLAGVCTLLVVAVVYVVGGY
jgi:hypothetical protein